MCFRFLEERYDNTRKAWWKPKPYVCVVLVSGLFLWRGFVPPFVFAGERFLASPWPFRLFTFSFTLRSSFHLFFSPSLFLSLRPALLYFISSPLLWACNHSILSRCVISPSSFTFSFSYSLPSTPSSTFFILCAQRTEEGVSLEGLVWNELSP